MFEDYVRLANLWGPRHSVFGRTQEQGQIEESIRRETARLPSVQVQMIMPGGTPTSPSPAFSFSSAAPQSYEFTAEYPHETVKLDFDVVKHAKFNYGSVFGENSPHLIDAGRRVAEIIGAPFAFGDDRDAFVDPDLFDPRSRAWGITYYGPDLVNVIGRVRIESAPAAQVEFEPDGGAWVLLMPYDPFETSMTKEKVRAAVETHLDLAKLFPNVP